MDASGREANETLNLIVQELAKVSTTEGSVGPDTKLADLGIDSMKFMETLLTCLQYYPGFSDFENLSIDKDTSLRSLDQQLRGVPA
jgi:Phosphopantetheine attachment site